MDQLRKRFDQLTWPEASCAVSQPGATVIWPFGACEQHGIEDSLSKNSVRRKRQLGAMLLTGSKRPNHRCTRPRGGLSGLGPGQPIKSLAKLIHGVEQARSC